MLGRKKKDNEKTEKYNTNEEHGRNSKDQINKEELSNLPKREFRIMIVKIL